MVENLSFPKGTAVQPRQVVAAAAVWGTHGGLKEGEEKTCKVILRYIPVYTAQLCGSYHKLNHCKDPYQSWVGTRVGPWK